jgi:DNA-binding transcriptional MerR regulator
VTKNQLEKMRQAKYVGVAELADEAAKILAESGLAQERGTVSEVPDERTVRYYLTEGLVSPAEDKQGTASVFGYRHLLQLLVVKKLQSEHLPIRKIRDLVDGRTERELERLLGMEGGTAVKNEAMSYLEKLLMKPTPLPPSAAPAQALKQPSSIESLADFATATPPSPQMSGSQGTWSRIELEPGLELHVHDQYQPPRETKGLRKLTQAVLRVIELHGQRPRKRGS